MAHPAQLLLEALGADQRVTLQTLHHGRSHRALYSVAVSKNLDRLRVYNELGSDIYYTVNETTEYGRDTAHIRAMRAIFVDYDHGVPDRWELPPTAIIESSPGKAQCYWVLRQPLPMCMEHLSMWTDCENRWVAGTNGDWAARDCARILRLPGFLNHKYNPSEPVKLVELSDRRYGLAELRECYKGATLPAKGEWLPSSALTADNLPADEIREHRFRTWLSSIVPPVPGAGQRNAWFYRKACAAVVDFALDSQLAASILTEYGERHHGEKAYTYDELRTISARASTYAKGAIGSAYAKTAQTPVKEEL